jgi:hypothetical protein
MLLVVCNCVLQFKGFHDSGCIIAAKQYNTVKQLKLRDAKYGSVYTIFYIDVKFCFRTARLPVVIHNSLLI